MNGRGTNAIRIEFTRLHHLLQYEDKRWNIFEKTLNDQNLVRRFSCATGRLGTTLRQQNIVEQQTSLCLCTAIFVALQSYPHS